MSENKFDAVVNQVAGSAKELFGKITGDKKVESEGATEQVAEKVKEVVADAQNTVEGVVEGIKNSFGDKK